MSRSIRRASQHPSADALAEIMTRAAEHQRRGETGAAVHLYKKILTARPDHAGACEALARVYLAQGKLDKASQQFALLAEIMPQTLSPFPSVLDTLKQLNPALAAALANAR